MRLVTINALNLYAREDPVSRRRYEEVEQLVATLDADVVAVQEIVADQDSAVAQGPARLRRLAEATGMSCDVGEQVALAVGGGRHHTGLLWRDWLDPVPGSVARFDRSRAGLWHSAVTMVVDLDGARLRVGSVQLSPFDQEWGRRDAHQLLRAMQSDTVAGLLGGDFNGLGSDVDYDPDPYIGRPWHPDHAYQLADNGTVDRRVAIRLERIGRMRDCAVVTGAQWQPTTGHYPGDAHPLRRIDRWYATHHLPTSAVTGYEVLDTPITRACSDHLPVQITIDAQVIIDAGHADT